MKANATCGLALLFAACLLASGALAQTIAIRAGRLIDGSGD